MSSPVEMDRVLMSGTGVMDRTSVLMAQMNTTVLHQQHHNLLVVLWDSSGVTMELVLMTGTNVIVNTIVLMVVMNYQKNVT